MINGRCKHNDQRQTLGNVLPGGLWWISGDSVIAISSCEATFTSAPMDGVESGLHGLLLSGLACNGFVVGFRSESRHLQICEVLRHAFTRRNNRQTAAGQ
jgi:hypothetical protein